jgi:hypothetical protein
METQLRAYEGSFQKMGRECDERAKYKSQVEELVLLFESMRKDNEELKAGLEQRNLQLNVITEKYWKVLEKVEERREMGRTRVEERGERSGSEGKYSVKREGVELI